MKKLKSYSDTIIVVIKKKEVYLTGTFNDGYAILSDEDGKNYFMTYPKAKEVTPSMKAEIEEYTNHKLESFFDIALKYGEIDNKELGILRKREIVYGEMLDVITSKMDEAGRTRITLNGVITLKSPDGNETLTPLAFDKENDGEIKVQCLYVHGEVENEGFFHYKKDEFITCGTVIVDYIYNNINDLTK